MPRKTKAKDIAVEVFAPAYVKHGFNGADAASEAYDVSTRDSASSMAYKALSRPEVQERIQAILNADGHGLEKFGGHVEHLAFHAEKESVQLAATQEALKLLNAYPDQKVTVETKLPNMSGATLEQLQLVLSRVKLPSGDNMAITSEEVENKKEV